MSAITGIYHFNEEFIPHNHGMSLMQSLQKYPADDVQVWQRDNVFLGCHAQWITPESIGEILPYYDSQRQLTITADAIIDNRKELFERLKIDKARQHLMPDSQLILLAYSKWGEETPKHLIGDFAFMIWDERENKLFGARDFSGGRTLYYFHRKEKFVFSTVIHPLLTLPYIGNQLDERWLAEYLAIPGMNEAVDTSITPYKDIQQLSPSHSITVTGGRVKLKRYCTITKEKTLKLRSNEEYEEAFQEVFQIAINSRLRTNREVGAHLSGGLDSGAVASFAARALKKGNKRLHTFSYVPSTEFEDWTSKNKIADERPFIKSTVNYVGNISDNYSDFSNIDPLSEIDDWLEVMEMPYKFFANSHWIKGIYHEANERNIGVLLNGGRGNLSISWGPALNYYAVLLKKLKWIKLYQELNQYSKKAGGNRLRRLPVISKIAFPSLYRVVSKKEYHEFPMLINPELAKNTKVYEKLSSHGIETIKSNFNNNVYNSRKKHFEELYPWNATGTLGTKLSLKYSLWKRDPTNDLRVIKFCLSLPEEQYVQNGLDRSLVRRSTKNLLPDKVRLNQRVRGSQGVDYIHRMMPNWNSLINELEKISNDTFLLGLINKQVFKEAITKVKNNPRPELAMDPEFWILMRGLILYRFINTSTERR